MNILLVLVSIKLLIFSHNIMLYKLHFDLLIDNCIIAIV